MSSANLNQSPSQAGIPDFQQIGLRIRSTRHRKNLTLATVAEQAQIDKSFLSRIERGEKSASVGTLHMIAAALQTSLSLLLGEGIPKEAIRVSRHDDRTPPPEPGNQSRAHHFKTILPAGLETQLSVMELWVGTEGLEETVVHGGEEVIFVLDGTVEIDFSDYRVTLEASDSVNFPGYLPHSLYAKGDTSARVLVIIAGDGNA